MHRYINLVMLLAFGIVLQHSHGIEVNVTDKDQKLCLYANLMVNISVTYEGTDNKSKTIEFELPSNATSNTSKCGVKSSLLMLHFGGGHSWSLSFTLNKTVYQTDAVNFSYNLGDSHFFPNSSSKEYKSVIVQPRIAGVGIGTCYSCKSKETFEKDSVNQTLWNVLIQAFVINGSKSESLTSCSADMPTTTVAPTTAAPNTTTAAPNTTTVAPNTTTTASTTISMTTAQPTTTPLPIPVTGNYSVKLKENSTACLLASFGLRIGVRKGENYEEMNLDPNRATAHGSCDDKNSELVLESDVMNIAFSFTNDAKKFQLNTVNATVKTSSGVSFSERNTNLSLWEASLRSSYMCNKEQNFTIISVISLFTFSLHVQPFEVNKGVFSTAHECSLDDVNITIPIIVGAVLVGLILIVVIAYLIGRRKTHAGYQTL